MIKETITPRQEQVDDLSHVMKAALGAAVVSLVTSFSTNHIVAAAHEIASPAELGHAFEREREVLHGHANLGRVRYATVSGASE